MKARKITQVGDAGDGRKIIIEVEAIRADVYCASMFGPVSQTDDVDPGPMEVIEMADDLALLVGQTIRAIEGKAARE